MKLIFLVILLFVPFVSAQTCQSGQEQPCGYNNVGECQLGTQYCQGGSWSQCFGAKWPSQEVCFDNKDNDCDNATDENCLCQDGVQRACGPDTDEGVCTFGTETCQNNAWGPCQGAVYPLFADLCNNNLDDDCDGDVDGGCGGQQVNQAVPHCFNNVEDGDEIGVDCGGSCRSCVSCTDGILNQGEEKIRVDLGNGTISDCGGTNCPSCPSCFDGMKNQHEVGIDCGGECRACVEEPKDDDHDGLSEQEELLRGTNPFASDSDRDGMNDKVDRMPLCPNTRCDQQFGEDEKNCPGDCGEKSGLVVGIVFVVVFVVGAYLYFTFRRGMRRIATARTWKEDTSPSSFDIEKYHQLEEKKGKKKKTNVEEEVERSLTRAEHFLRR